VAAAGTAALKIVQEEPHRRKRLWALSDQLRRRLQSANLDVGTSTTQIVPVIVGDPARTLELSANLRDRGFIVPAIRPPSVPAGESLLRVSLSSEHTESMIEELAGHLIELIGNG
jgi:8-amino-7-oxononanoate synthase